MTHFFSYHVGSAVGDLPSTVHSPGLPLFWQVAEHRKEGLDGPHRVSAESSRGQSRINYRWSQLGLFSPGLMVGSTTPHLSGPPTGTVNTTKLTGITTPTEKNGSYRSDSEKHPHSTHLSAAPQPHLLYDMMTPLKSPISVAHIVFSVYWLPCIHNSSPSGITANHRPLGHLGAHYMNENTVRTDVHAQTHEETFPSRDPHCCRNHCCAREKPLMCTS